MRSAGIDIGSRYIKFALLEDGAILKTRVVETGHDPMKVCQSILDAEDGPEPLVATGYGRHLLEVLGDIPAITEIKAVAIGARAVFQCCRTVVDIGGQDTKVIVLDAGGRVVDFEMNDRCAAGTGRFLEIMAKTLGYSLQEFGTPGRPNAEEVSINSMCTVFAESEVVSLIAKGTPRDRIAAALNASVANRVASLAKRHPLEEDVVFAGGCAYNQALRAMLEERLRRKLLCHQQPEFLAAYGAALHAQKNG